MPRGTPLAAATPLGRRGAAATPLRDPAAVPLQDPASVGVEWGEGGTGPGRRDLGPLSKGSQRK